MSKEKISNDIPLPEVNKEQGFFCGVETKTNPLLSLNDNDNILIYKAPYRVQTEYFSGCFTEHDKQ